MPVMWYLIGVQRKVQKKLTAHPGKMQRLTAEAKRLLTSF